MSISQDPDGLGDQAPPFAQAVADDVGVSEQSTASAGGTVEDEALVRAVVAGDRVAADELIRRFRGLIVGLACKRYGYGSQEVDDLLQSVITLLWRDDFRALRAWRGQGRFSTYLSVIVCRECRRQRGLHRRRSVVEASVDFDEPPSSSPDPNQQTLANERSRVLRQALAQLQPKDRLVLSFRFFDDRRPSEFGPVLGLSAGAARKAVHDALGRLRAKMGRALGAGVQGRRD